MYCSPSSPRAGASACCSTGRRAWPPPTLHKHRSAAPTRLGTGLGIFAQLLYRTVLLGRTRPAAVQGAEDVSDPTQLCLRRASGGLRDDVRSAYQRIWYTRAFGVNDAQQHGNVAQKWICTSSKYEFEVYVPIQK